MKELLLGIVLGDGYLEPHGKGVRLQVNHAERFAFYVKWKREALHELIPGALHRNHNNGYPFWRFVTKSHPDLAELRRLFYVDGKKIIPDNIQEMLVHPQSLAVWFMDDGTCDKRQGSMLFETQCFDASDVERLRETLQTNFDVGTKAHRCGVGRKGCRLYVSVAEAKKLRKIIAPYVLPEMRYKLFVPRND